MRARKERTDGFGASHAATSTASAAVDGDGPGPGDKRTGRRGLQLSLHLGNVAPTEPASWDRLFTLAELADRTGVDRVAVSDHIVLGEALENYARPELGGTKGGQQPTGPDGHWLDPLVVLSMVAARTTRVRVATSILLAALRPAAVLAKQSATLDVLSGGRLDLGVGVGWQREEYEACGLNFDRRGALLDDRLSGCQRLWTEDVVDGSVGDARFVRVRANPKPHHPTGVPLWIAGRASARTARRVARFGVGWIPWGDDIDRPAPGIAMMRAALEASGRDPAQLQVQGRLQVHLTSANLIDVERTLEPVAALADNGITEFRIGHRFGADLVADEQLLLALVPSFDALAASDGADSGRPSTQG